MEKGSQAEKEYRTSKRKNNKIWVKTMIESDN